MSKLFICLAVVSLCLLLAACGTTEPDYQPEPDITYTAAEEPEAPPPATTPTPSPTPPPAAPPIPGILAGAEEDLYFSQIPIPPQPLDLSITRRVISAGRDMSAVITEDGSAWAWGGFRSANWFDQAELIIQGHEAGTIFVTLMGDTDANTGYTQFMPFIPDGTIWYDGYVHLGRYGYPGSRYNILDLHLFRLDGTGMGLAGFNQLHAEQTVYRLTPRHVADGIASVTAHSRGQLLYTISENGVLEVPGILTQPDGRRYPSPNTFIENVVDVSAAFHRYGSIFLAEGMVLSDGSFEFFELDANMRRHGIISRPFDEYVTAIAHGMYHMLLLAYDGTLWGMGTGEAAGVLFHAPESPPVFVMDNVAYICARFTHSMALTKDGRLYAWGSNISTQIGDGSRQARPTPVFIMDNIVAISAGGAHSMAIDADGVLWGWGSNTNGQVGNRSLPQHTTPVQVMEDVVAVSAGYAHTIAVTSDGTLWAWGANTNGQLGDGTQNDSPVPIQIKTGVMIP